MSAEELGNRVLSRHEASVCIDRACERARRKGLPGRGMAGVAPSSQPRPAAKKPSGTPSAQNPGAGEKPSESRSTATSSKAAAPTPAKSAPLGICPLCGEPLIEASGGRKVRCPSNRWRKGDEGWYLAEGDGFEFWRELGGKALTRQEVRELATLQKVTLASGAEARLEQVEGGIEKGWRVKVARGGVYGRGRG